MTHTTPSLLRPVGLMVLFVLLFGVLAWRALPGEAEDTRVPTAAQRELPTEKMAIAAHPYRVEVASTPLQAQTGLMFRKRLPKGRGMLFLFEPARPIRFWMKNTLIPLDMVFIHDGRVVHIERNVPPCQGDPCPTYGPSPDILVDSTVELPAGTANKDHIHLGDTARMGSLSAKNPSHAVIPSAGSGD